MSGYRLHQRSNDWKEKGTRPRGLWLPPRISDLLVVVGVKLHEVSSSWVVVVFCRSYISENGHRDPDGMSTGGTQQVLRTRLNERTMHMHWGRKKGCLGGLAAAKPIIYRGHAITSV